ncbi:endothelial cell-selective adhesion molecule-like [Scleropages formosus]|uniref:endothelial cell-selective adhesion molecule-like n=1 Tax=Scleropages formosus TaxID=113540 RepID=UPI000879020B|nr:endothelial cell-selective adhesion molecule-like [Scleropages formosus]
MDTSRKLGALLFLALLWALPGDSQRVEIPRKDMEVIRGQIVVLQAWYSPTSDIDKNTVIWNFMANDSKQIISYSSGQIGIGSPEFRKRVGFALSMPSTNLSIFINNTQESDSGRYLCNVIIPGAPGLSGELRLNVKVPPSIPVCKMTGTPVLKGNVTLSCRSKAGKPVPQYKWTKSAPASEVFFSPMQTWRACPQPLLVLGYLDEKQGTLRLSNLTQGMSGKYVCRASNTAGSESCYINLEVAASSNVGMIAGATVGSLLGLVAIILFLVFIIKRRREGDEDVANEIKEDAQAPKRVSWARSGTGSDNISKNGTLSSLAASPRPHNHCTHNPASDTASILTAVGSAAGYRLRPGDPSVLQGLPGYNGSSTLPRRCPPAASYSSSPLHRTDGAQPQAPRHPFMPPTAVTRSNISRMGGVPVMVPTQNQAGSLV